MPSIEEMKDYLEKMFKGKGGKNAAPTEETHKPRIDPDPDIRLRTADYEAGMTAIVESVLEDEDGEPKSFLRPDEYLDGLEQVLALLGMAATNPNRLLDAYPQAKLNMSDPHAVRLNAIIDAFTNTQKNSKAYPYLNDRLKKNMRFKLD